MKKIIVLLLLINFSFSFSQQQNDTLIPRDLKEVIVIGKKSQIHEKQGKSLGTIDEFLQKGNKVDMIKRGAYAWEPIINSMTTERTLITIDGMRIFGACTDKMDPITSYVEVSNLSEATVHSGQQGSCFGSTIGGAIDLKRNQNAFGNQKWDFTLNSGFETNNKQKIIGSSVSYSDSLYYFDTDFMLRNANNYKAGNDREIMFSQFKKINFSGTSGFKFHKNKLFEASVIYDKATDVGYPALPMDVSLAEALITSLKFVVVPKATTFKDWETKVYFNTITHRMDDTKRPSVPIHMDMPGWSETYGMYSKLKGVRDKHHFLLNLNSFYNKSVAEMTMYPENPNENPMFMYTWPDVRTFYAGVFAEDNLAISCHSNLKFSISLGSHSNAVASEFGLQSLKIFYPEMKAKSNRFLKSFSSNYSYNKGAFDYGFGLGYGERAPSVSEGYGFYLFNSSDRFDYIGNPNLENEKSVEGNVFLGYKLKKFNAKITSSYFHISNYIIGKPDLSLIPMTIGGNGVKIYTAMDYAMIFNVDFSAEFEFSNYFKWRFHILYSKGKDSDSNDLPLINPMTYKTSFIYNKQKISASFECIGNAAQTQFGSTYGESSTADFAILNANVGYKISFSNNKIFVKVGVENILDKYYTTYADWNKIPQMGRNIFINVLIGL